MKILNIRITYFLLMILMAAAAFGYQVVLLPAIKIHKEVNTYILPGMVEVPTPFWPQYWRRVRNLPEPDDPDEIIRCDDGGLILMAVIALPVAFALAYRFRRYLIRRA